MDTNNMRYEKNYSSKLDGDKQSIINAKINLVSYSPVQLLIVV